MVSGTEQVLNKCVTAATNNLEISIRVRVPLLFPPSLSHPPLLPPDGKETILTCRREGATLCPPIVCKLGAKLSWQWIQKKQLLC